MQEVDSHFERSGAIALACRSPAETSPNSPDEAGAPCGGPSLARIVETEILPRLLLAHRPRRTAPTTFTCESRLDADLLADILLHGDGDKAWAFVDALARDGVAPRR